MRKLLTGLMVLIGLAGGVQAAGDPQAGEKMAASCQACHGQGGAGPIQDSYPKIAALGENYLFKQLRAIQSGERQVAQMAGQLDGKSEQQLWDLAAYFDQQEASTGEADPELVDAGEALYRGGNLANDVAACIACHGPGGKGNEPAGYPRLSGQNAEYVASSLKGFKSGERVYDEQSGIMGDIASRLTESEIEAVAEYIEGLH